MDNIRLIPDTYRRSSMFTHTCHKRGEHALVFKVTQDPSFGSKKPGPVYFEVFKRKIGKGGMTKFPNSPAKIIEPFESRPGDNSFGTWAWAIVSEQDAMKRFDELEANPERLEADAPKDIDSEDDEDAQ